MLFTCCFRISFCDRCKGNVSRKEWKQLKHSTSMKNTAANKVSIKYKKQCQMPPSLRKKKNNSDKSQVLSINYPYFTQFVELKLLRKSNWFSLLRVTLRLYVVLVCLPFVPNKPFLYRLKTSENLTVFWCFQGGREKAHWKKMGWAILYWFIYLNHLW